eukprot:GAHX01001020.1.p2 GENE.GAHX01001020.1~~GAHX01001020.1.p2  ORF type:complete len:100 (-),score=19.98 GAHX01001020.1:46-345(-)
MHIDSTSGPRELNNGDTNFDDNSDCKRNEIVNGRIKCIKNILKTNKEKYSAIKRSIRGHKIQNGKSVAASNKVEQNIQNFGFKKRKENSQKESKYSKYI